MMKSPYAATSLRNTEKPLYSETLQVKGLGSFGSVKAEQGVRSILLVNYGIR